MIIKRSIIFFNTFLALSAFCSGIEGNFLENVLLNIRNDHKSDRGMHDIDPFPIKKVYDWELPLLKLHLSLDTYIGGFMNYDIHKASVTPDLKMTLNTTLESVTFEGIYNLNGTYYKIVPLKGNGNIFIQLNKFTFYTDMQIAPNNGTLKLLHYDMDFNYGSLEVSVSGLTGETDVGEIIKQLIKDFVPNTFRRKRKQIIPFIIKLAMTKGNDYLKKATLNTFIEMAKTLFIY